MQGKMLTITDISDRVGYRSFERGLEYARAGHIINPRIQGELLKSECIGSASVSVSRRGETGRCWDRGRLVFLPGGRRWILQARRCAAAHLARSTGPVPRGRGYEKGTGCAQQAGTYRHHRADDGSLPRPGSSARDRIGSPWRRRTSCCRLGQAPGAARVPRRRRRLASLISHRQRPASRPPTRRRLRGTGGVGKCVRPLCHRGADGDGGIRRGARRRRRTGGCARRLRRRPGRVSRRRR